jgi:hypothetical protein
MPTHVHVHWKEEDHPRARGGQFSKTQGGGAPVDAGRRTPPEAAPKDLDGAKLEIRKSLGASRGPVTTLKLAQRTGIERGLLADALKDLQARGVAVQTGSGWVLKTPGGSPPAGPPPAPPSGGGPKTPPMGKTPIDNSMMVGKFSQEQLMSDQYQGIRTIVRTRGMGTSVMGPALGTLAHDLKSERTEAFDARTVRLQDARLEIKKLNRQQFDNKYRVNARLNFDGSHSPELRQHVEDIDDTSRLIWAALPKKVRDVITKNEPMQLRSGGVLGYVGPDGNRSEALGLHWNETRHVTVAPGRHDAKTYSRIGMASLSSTPWGQRKTAEIDKTFTHEVGHGVDHNTGYGGSAAVRSTYRDEYRRAMDALRASDMKAHADTIAKYHMSNSREAFAESFAVLFNPVGRPEEKSYFWGLTRDEALMMFPETIGRTRDYCASHGILVGSER